MVYAGEVVQTGTAGASPLYTVTRQLEHLLAYLSVHMHTVFARFSWQVCLPQRPHTVPQQAEQVHTCSL